MLCGSTVERPRYLELWAGTRGAPPHMAVTSAMRLLLQPPSNDYYFNFLFQVITRSSRLLNVLLYWIVSIFYYYNSLLASIYRIVY